MSQVEQPMSRAQRNAMERQCRYRGGDGFPCRDLVDCLCPDELLLANEAERLLEHRRRFHQLRERVQERSRKHAAVP